MRDDEVEPLAHPVVDHTIAHAAENGEKCATGWRFFEVCEQTIHVALGQQEFLKKPRPAELVAWEDIRNPMCLFDIEKYHGWKDRINLKVFFRIELNILRILIGSEVKIRIFANRTVRNKIGRAPADEPAGEIKHSWPQVRV
ncbi:hypothetical protein [Phyllobacterium sp. SYP-B3895]|uniref:hypothetical protein n=1 Tax=Phyllobacterium sp. SYP-B3895 TaxID=2663240 RepID=UPI001561E256|nr:hypothetical protein [Phyllobacterium sp. SYP-B3895]